MKIIKILLCLFFVIAIAFSAYADGSELVTKIDAVVSQGPENGNYFVGANDVYMWLKMKKTDFVVVDVRIGENAINAYKSAHIPGAIYIPYNEVFKSENLQKLPKDKKIVLACHMGASESLLIVPLRMLNGGLAERLSHCRVCAGVNRCSKDKELSIGK